MKEELDKFNVGLLAVNSWLACMPHH